MDSENKTIIVSQKIDPTTGYVYSKWNTGIVTVQEYIYESEMGRDGFRRGGFTRRHDVELNQEIAERIDWAGAWENPRALNTGNEREESTPQI